MKSLLFSALTILFLSQGFAATGGQDGNGGAGVVKNGRQMTFYTAGLYVRPVPQFRLHQEVPAIDDLFNYFADLKNIGAATKAKYLYAIQPSSERRYEIAVPERLTPEVRARLLAEFKRVTNIDPHNMQLFAITDIPQRTTYLLPGFEKLDRVDQITILFHEAYWLTHPNAKYQEVVDAEMAFQASYTDPNDGAALYDFISRIGATKSEITNALVRWDLQSGNLRGLLNKKNQIKVSDLYGDEFMNCFLPRVGLYDSGPAHTCDILFLKHINTLIRKFPKSMVLRKIADNLASSREDKVVVLRSANLREQYAAETYPSGPNKLRNAMEFISRERAEEWMSCPIHLGDDYEEYDCDARGLNNDIFHGQLRLSL